MQNTCFPQVPKAGLTPGDYFDWLQQNASFSEMGALTNILQQEQKNVFWFRLKNFDPDILSHIEAIKRQNRCYVPYYATHHFFGKGNWIWYIPMRSPENEQLVSIGITYRKDVYPYGEPRTMEQFLDCVGREHPVIADIVRSGAVVDTNSYGSYKWECRRRYSSDRWYVIGDAGDTVDPLYSVGLALSSLQIRQIAAIIQRELAEAAPS